MNYVTPETIDEIVDRWLDRIRGMVWSRTHLTIVPSKCALLIIDMLNHFAHPNGRAYLPATAAIVPKIAKLRDTWLEIGSPVIYTRHCHEGEHDLGMLGKFWSDYIRCDEPDSQILETLKPGDNCEIIRKNTYDAFYQTELEQILRQQDISQVLITGVLTQMCCETTARSAFVRGYEVYVGADATATSSEQLHLNSLLSMATAVAVIVKTDELFSGNAT